MMTCKSGKLCYPDRTSARLVLLRCKTTNKHWRRRERRAYRCPLCNAFHLTSQRPKPRERSHA